MIRNYIKIAWRNFLKNKGYSAINIGGLSVGMAVAMLIGLWIHYELNFGNEHANKSQLFNVVTNGIDANSGNKFTTQSTPLPLYTASKNLIPEVKYSAVVNWSGKNGLMVGDMKLIKNGGDVSEDFFKMFKYKFVEGDPNTALNDPNSIVLTESTAHDLFDGKEAFNKTVRWNNSQDLKVTGIIQDIPASTYFGERQYFMPFSNFENRESWVKNMKDSWENYSARTYVELIAGATREQVLPKIRNIIKTNNNKTKNEIGLHAMSEWRLYDVFENWEASGGRIVYVKMFAVIGLLILLLACINFMNLSTARSEKRAKEIGVRKAVGSERKQIIFQFLAESILMAAIAMVLSIALLFILLKAFNSVLQTEVLFPHQHPLFWLLCISFVFITGLLAGSYPALYLSSFSSIKALKGKIRLPNAVFSPRKVLVVTQFVASIALIIGTIVIYKQIQFTKNRPIGYDARNIVMVDMKDDLIKNYNVVKDEVMATGLIENITKASNAIIETRSNSVITDFPGKVSDEKMSMVNIATSGNYFNTMKIKLLAGRDFNQLNFEADTNKVILNQAAVDQMNVKDPIGKMITEQGGRRYEIIGVAQNTIMENPFENVRPARFICDPNWAGIIMMRMKANVAASKAMAAITPIFSKYNPSFPFEYRFADEEFGKKFTFETMVGKLATFFAILAIFISCLGLFGLASFIAEQRTKEIGVRKILGSSVFNLWRLLSKDFIVLVIISCVIAAPVAYYFMQDWLQKYPYRTIISWWIFVAAGAGALIITLLTISFQAIKAAVANPIKSLKSE
jgi:ABC-type antimicrobial peptide transport system permease subunit